MKRVTRATIKRLYKEGKIINVKKVRNRGKEISEPQKLKRFMDVHIFDKTLDITIRFTPGEKNIRVSTYNYSYELTTSITL